MKHAILSISIALSSCSSASNDAPASGADAATDTSGGGDGTTTTAAVPEFGTDATRKLVVVGTKADGLAAPRDLEFAPDHPDQLWTVNQTTNGAVIYFDPGQPTQRAEARVDRYAEHFMMKVSAIAFGPGNTFATCQESRDEWNDAPQPPDDFMGPTLWLADLEIFAKVNQAFPLAPGAKEGSHIDMLHQSPLCMGIAHDTLNVYWAFDGLAGNIVRYDFQADHGPGGSSHGDGIVRRYVEAKVTRVPDVASHLVVDHDTGMLYVADTGGARVTRLDTKSGAVTGKLTKNDALAEYTKVEGAKYDVFASGLGKPSGVALSKGRLFVSDDANGDVVAYALDDARELGRLHTGASGIMGINFGPDGKLWFVDRAAETVVRIDP